MKRLIWLPLAGFLLIAGATVAAAAPSIVDSARGLIGAAGQGLVDGSAALTDADAAIPGHGLLDEVLTELVDQGVITQVQADAITGALETRIEEQRAEMEARREQMRETAEQVRTFLEDGVITQDEINQLPDDNPLREVFNSIAENGQVTQEQLQQLGPGFGPGMGPGGPGMGPGRHHGPGTWFAPDGQDTNSDSDSDSDAGASPNS
jgi:hypothetical protein